uniref:(northern house mosquito) hypothetical protein n=1 Tax=Culex pipiens TaxID=7175 RepID=A0A8D8CWE5_CULPI
MAAAIGPLRRFHRPEQSRVASRATTRKTTEISAICTSSTNSNSNIRFGTIRRPIGRLALARRPLFAAGEGGTTGPRSRPAEGRPRHASGCERPACRWRTTESPAWRTRAVRRSTVPTWTSSTTGCAASASPRTGSATWAIRCGVAARGPSTRSPRTGPEAPRIGRGAAGRRSRTTRWPTGTGKGATERTVRRRAARTGRTSRTRTRWPCWALPASARRP